MAPRAERTVPTHCEQCTQRFAEWEDRFLCRWGCYGDFHAECQLVHHDDHELLKVKEA